MVYIYLKFLGRHLLGWLLLTQLFWRVGNNKHMCINDIEKYNNSNTNNQNPICLF